MSMDDLSSEAHAGLMCLNRTTTNAVASVPTLSAFSISIPFLLFDCFVPPSSWIIIVQVLTYKHSLLGLGL